MPEVGVRELKAKTSEILRAIRERRARYVVTYRGRPVAALIPLDDAAAVEAPGGEREAWGRLERRGAAVGDAALGGGFGAPIYHRCERIPECL